MSLLLNSFFDQDPYSNEFLSIWSHILASIQPRVSPSNFRSQISDHIADHLPHCSSPDMRDFRVVGSVFARQLLRVPTRFFLHDFPDLVVMLAFFKCSTYCSISRSTNVICTRSASMESGLMKLRDHLQCNLSRSVPGPCH